MNENLKNELNVVKRSIALTFVIFIDKNRSLIKHNIFIKKQRKVNN